MRTLSYRLRRSAAALVIVLMAGQLIVPLHDWLESGARTVHHDGFQWAAAGDLPDGVRTHDAAHPPHACAESGDCGELSSCHAQACAYDGSDAGDDGSCGDDASCHDDGCGSCCHHIPIQCALRPQTPDRDMTVFLASTPAVLDILPGILPAPFLPPRSLS